eukprot:4733863-Amphidinium_carterae.1
MGTNNTMLHNATLAQAPSSQCTKDAVCVSNERERQQSGREIDENNEKEIEDKELENKKYIDENKDNNDEYDEEQEEMQTLNTYRMENRTIGMMQKMNIKLPSPTQFDGRSPQFSEWAGEVKAYLSVHNVNIEDIMDDCTKSATVIQLGDVQDKYTADEVRKFNTTYPVALQDGEDGYDDYMDMT